MLIILQLIMFIPFPEQIYPKQNNFILNKDTKIYFDDNFDDLKLYFFNQIKEFTDYNLGNSIFDNSEIKVIKKDINFSYILEIDRDSLQIIAKDREGLFHGFQSVFQIIYQFSTKNEIKIPCMTVRDSPRFQWRGFMLDEARHFQGKEIVKEILDLMALLKLNKFHWHLTDDQGWRIDLENFPKLREIGSKRETTRTGGYISSFTKKETQKPHFGCYTKDEIKEIILYAQERFIEVIPEIDLPGHTSALIASYPKLSCHEKQIKIPITFGIKTEILCPSKETTFDFIKKILDEIIVLFPSNYFHIGGDEVKTTNWQNCQKCTKKLAESNFSDYKDLQFYFTSRIIEYLKSKGKQLIMWNDGLVKGIDKEVIGQYWFPSKKKFLRELKNGRKFILSNFFRTYFDYNYKFTPLKKVYDFDPILQKINMGHNTNILGIEATLWTEWVDKRKRLFWQILPRLIAIAEINWTINSEKDYQEFLKRVDGFINLLKTKSIPCAKLSQTDPNLLKRIFGVFSHLINPKLEFQ